MTYREFLEQKTRIAMPAGFEISESDVHPACKPHQKASVVWAVRGGRRMLAQSFGLGKTIQQIEIVRICREHAGGPGMIVMPLGVRQEFTRDAQIVGQTLKFIRRDEEVERLDMTYITNYETVRDEKLDLSKFSAVSLDEASILRGFGGTKTFRALMKQFEGSGRYRFVATATPSPNEYIELLAYAAFLDIMDVGQAKTRFFERDSEHADNLTIRPHKEKEFWLWVASWALFLNKPSDIGFSDEGYSLPKLDVRWHEIRSDHANAGAERDGQNRMFQDSAVGVSHAAREKRNSLPARIQKLVDLRGEDPGAHRIIWHDLEDERRAIEEIYKVGSSYAPRGFASVFGSQKLELREEIIIDFSNGDIQELAAKPSIAGSGTNFQHHCHWEIFLGIGFKFNDFIQAVHRCYRFLQSHDVRIDLIYTEGERAIRKVLEEKWQRHNEQAAIMAAIIREYGLAGASMAAALQRSIGIERVEVQGEGFRLVNNDTVEETAGMESNSVDMILTSIPFATQYQYSPSYNDFGHTDNNDHFWQQMDFLTVELLRVLRPGRVAAIHVKDRITPGGITGLGFQTVQRFSDQTATHFEKHGFAFLGRKTVVTDVVRENAQTYRLGWSEQCRDGSRMGVGMSEYIMLFRKPQTDRSKGYADVPVVKEKPLCDDYGVPAPFDKRKVGGNWKQPVPGTGYSRGRWQFDAHGFTRSSGNRILSSTELRSLPHDQIYRLWKSRSINAVYDFEGHVLIAEELDRLGKLPPDFMLLPPHSSHPDVWTDVARMRTLNMTQAAQGHEMHLCPLQFDIVDRLITQFTMKGETVYDPFSGLGTVAYCAVKLGRTGLGVELNSSYFRDSVEYLKAAAAKANIPTLFDLMEMEAV